MEGVTPLPQISIEKAKLEHRRYCELLKTHPSDHAETMKNAYYALGKGQPIIDVHRAFWVSGKLDNDMPRLAIARAHLQKCVFERRKKGAGAFWSPEGWNSNNAHPSLRLPKSTFSNWRIQQWPKRYEFGNTRVSAVTTIVPPIPAEHYPKGRLSRYFILWEVEENGWEATPDPPGDPMLLKRISPNLFTVLAAWDLTELEKAVLRGTIRQ